MSSKYHPPRLIDGKWCIEVEDLNTRLITKRFFHSEELARIEHTELTQRQHWDKKRRLRNRSR